MNVADLNWVAGFFDGEGCVYIAPTVPSNSRLTVTQKDRTLLEQFESIVQAGGGIYHTGKDGQYWQLIYGGSRAIVVGKMILPYLRNSAKVERLEVLFEKCGYLLAI
jgi:hypothetical protein